MVGHLLTREQELLANAVFVEAHLIDRNGPSAMYRATPDRFLLNAFLGGSQSALDDDLVLFQVEDDRWC